MSAYREQDGYQMRLVFGSNSIVNYRRLDYELWYALAEFVDNSTQAYFDNKDLLDTVFEDEADILEVSIIFNRDNKSFRIADNSIGMDREELEHAMHVGGAPANPIGRSQYGMGLKTAATWLGAVWTVTTKKLGASEEHSVTVDVNKVATGDDILEYRIASGIDPRLHYTYIDIADSDRIPQTKTVAKAREYLRSMYRHDLRTGMLRLLWQGVELAWDDGDNAFLKRLDGSDYRREIDIEVGGHSITGWAGVLQKGGRGKAGFSLMRHNRVIIGPPTPWKPETIYGGDGGSNDLVNQRLVGELHVNDFDVTHTKDNIVWLGHDEAVQDKLAEECSELVNVAKVYRSRADGERGPTDLEVRHAIDEFKEELASSELVDAIEMTEVAEPELAAAALRPAIESVADKEPTFAAAIGDITVHGFLADELSPNDPYVSVEATGDGPVVVVINLQHPFIGELSGSAGFLNYLRECTYDALAEYRAMRKQSLLNPDSVKILKDILLRLPSQIEMSVAQATDAAADSGVAS